MLDDTQNPSSLRPQELEALYTLSWVVAKADNLEGTLEEVTRLARSVLIFDSLVLYEKRVDDTLEPKFARAIGRGRFREADLAWGEYVANDAFQSRQTIIRTEEVRDNLEHEQDRTGLRYFLSLPLSQAEQILGALVFIRFGGPDYLPDQVNLAEFIALHVAQLLGHRHLVARVANLEAKRRLDNLQDDFIATISHELLTPLGFIKGYATTLLRDDTIWDETTRLEFLTIIDEEADRLHELIDNLMDSSRLQSGTLRMNYQPMRVDTLVRDISLRAKSRDENMQIKLDFRVTGLQIEADPTRLAQVFDNLLGNASKYAPGAPVTISLEQDSDHVIKIVVADRGPGIPSQHIEHLFKRFYRVQDKASNVRGTGLGLYICRQIVHQHGGEIWVESQEGEGTTFTIKLPIEHKETAVKVEFGEKVT